MLTRDDLIDLIVGRLAAEPGSAGKASVAEPAPRIPEVKGRPFLSEWVIKRMLTASAGELTIPKDAILSPLAQDWLALQRVKITRR